MEKGKLDGGTCSFKHGFQHSIFVHCWRWIEEDVKPRYPKLQSTRNTSKSKGDDDDCYSDDNYNEDLEYDAVG